MGTYLSTPILEKHVEKGSDVSDPDAPVRWAVVDMQGWRKSMEDAHVARTDVALPSCLSGQGGDNGGGEDEGGDSNNDGEPKKEGGEAADGDNSDCAGPPLPTSPGTAKVFAVFDGHGGAEVARFCQMHLVRVLTSHGLWTAEHDREWATQNLAQCLGQALVDSFHALDRLIDDPASRGEIERWRNEVPPPYVHEDKGDVEEKDDAPIGQAPENSPENKDELEAENLDCDEVQQRRHTVMDASEIALDEANALDEDREDKSEKSEQNMNDGVFDNSPGEEGEGAKEEEDIEREADKIILNGTGNNPSPSDADDGDEEDVFQDSLSEHPDEDTEDLENKVSDGIVRDDSDDEKDERATDNEDDDGEVDEVAKGEEKEAGTMVLSANDAVALFQKLLHMNGPPDADGATEVDKKEGEGEVAMNGEKMSEDGGGGDGGGGEEMDDGGGGRADMIPTQTQLLNPPQGTGPPLAAVPTRIVSGRKVRVVPHKITVPSIGSPIGGQAQEQNFGQKRKSAVAI